jgi:hypothetical protein
MMRRSQFRLALAQLAHEAAANDDVQITIGLSHYDEVSLESRRALTALHRFHSACLFVNPLTVAEWLRLCYKMLSGRQMLGSRIGRYRIAPLNLARKSAKNEPVFRVS